MEVEGPDGVIIEFPDGTDPSIIKGVMSKRYGAPQTPTQPGPKQMGSILPISRQGGDLQFDMDAGIPGVIKSGAMLPGDVASGEVPRMVPQYPDEVGKSELGALMVRNPEYYDRAMDTAVMGTPVNPAVRSGDRAIAGVGRTLQRAKVEPPTAEQLYKVGSRQFDKGRKLGVKFDPQYINELGRQAQTRMVQEGFDPSNAPKTFAVLKDMQSAAEPGAFAAYDDILKIRSRLKKARMDFNNPADKAAAERLIKMVEGFVEKSPGTRGVLSGPAGELAKSHKDALGNYAAASRSRDIGNLEKSALRRSAASNSGKNIGNTIRQRAASLLDSPKKLKGFSPEEIAKIEQVANGTATQNTLRDISHILGGGGGFGNLFAGTLAGGAGYAAGGPLGAATAGAATMGAGRLAKAGTNALTRRAMQNVDKMTRMRSPLYEQMIKSAEWKAASTAKKSAMLKSLLATIQQQQQMEMTVSP